jgi:hypothetical protein
MQKKYHEQVVPALRKKFNYKSVMQVPRITKICLNRGVNGAVADKKLIDVAIDELTQITGQKAVATISRKDISNFKLRKSMPIGARVTLRGSDILEALEDVHGVHPDGLDGIAALHDEDGGQLEAGDPAALAAHWTDAGESVDLVSGEVTAGRDAVRDVFAALFADASRKGIPR